MRRTTRMPSGFDATNLEHLAGAVRFGFREYGMELETVVNGEAVFSDDPVARPGEERIKLAPDFTATKLADLAASQKDGKSLVAWEKGAAYAARPLPFAVELRDVFAEHLGVSKTPWDVEVQVRWHESGRIDRVELLRVPRVSPLAEARMKVWKELVARIPGADEGWTVTEDAIGGNSVTLAWGVKPVLPSLVVGPSLLPTQYPDPEWSKFTVGSDAFGRPVQLDLAAGPHSLVVGGTGSGKSVSIRIIMLNALLKGFDVIVIDPTKKAAGLKQFEPWTRGIFTQGIVQASDALDRVYDEVVKRVSAIDEVMGEDWRDLPEGSVKPLYVVIDEVAALLRQPPKPVGVGRESPILREWEARASAVANFGYKLAKIAAEARSAGVHLLLSMQRPDTSLLPGEVRENLGTVLQLVAPARPPSVQALGMIFSGDAVAEAQEQIALLNDGESRGFGLSYTDGGQVTGFRVGFMEMNEIPVVLTNFGVPHGVPLIPTDRQAPPVTYAPIVADDATPRESDSQAPAY